MKKSIVTFAFLCFILFSYAQKVIEWPEFKGTTAPYIKILKIELHDTATVMDFRVHFTPNMWIRVPKETWIQDNNGGEKLYVKSAKGIKINEEHYTPENGLNEYTLYFPPVGNDVQSIDYMEDQWKIFGIELAPGEHFSIFPEELLSNWLRTDGSNEWVYGFYDDLVIYNSEIWKQVLISQKEDFYQLMLQKDGKKKKLIAKPKGDQLLIGPDEASLELFSKNLTNNSGYVIPNDEGFQLPIFNPDTAYYRGYMKGYDPRMGETGMVYVNNVLASGQESYLITINDDGTFSASIPILYPQLLLVRFMRNNENIWFESGKTTFQFFDFSGYHDDPEPGNLFMGATAKVNNDLMGMKDIRYFDYHDMQKEILDMSPEEYKEYNLEVKKKEQDALKEYIHNNPVSKKAREIKEMQITYSNARNIFSYNINRTSAYRMKNNMPRDQREIPLEREELSKEFFDFITPDEINNPLALTTGGDYYFFINRLMFADPVRPTGSISVRDYDITAADFEKKGITLDLENKELLNKLAECETKEDLAKLMANDSVLYREFRKKYDDVYSEIRSEKFNNIREQKRREGFREYFGFDSGFAWDIMKAQEVSRRMKSSFQSLADDQIENLRSDIESAFIVDYLLATSNELEKETARKKEAFNSKSGFVVNETPDAKSGDLFDTIMKKYEGNLVFVDFWATWCGPCRSGMERIKPLKEELKDKNIKFVYITNPSSPKKTWEIMMPDIDGEHYYLTQDEWNKMAARFKVSGIPHYVLVGKDGSVLKDKVYFASSNLELKQLFEENLD
jgi:thiol-disulfide isomerase/thioredoxin